MPRCADNDDLRHRDPGPGLCLTALRLTRHPLQATADRSTRSRVLLVKRENEERQGDGEAGAAGEGTTNSRGRTHKFRGDANRQGCSFPNP